MTETTLPILAGGLDPDAPIAWRDGRPISRRRFLADVEALAARLPADGPMLNLAVDRLQFATGLGAALVRGQTQLMPSNHTPDTVGRLRAAHPSTYALVDSRVEPGRDEPASPSPTTTATATASTSTSTSTSTTTLPMLQVDATTVAALRRSDAQPDAGNTASNEPSPRSIAPPVVPRVDAGHVAAQVLTSGSTGAPVPHAKRWGGLVVNTEAGARRLAEHLGRASLDGVTLVATVPPQHMYGFESTVLVALLAGAAFDVGRPFYPADIVAALARAPRPRMLVTTPFHLKALLESGLTSPPVDLVVCATAPLAPQLAARAEAALGGPLMEIYGCTEAGQIATRRTTAGPDWRTYEGLRLTGDGDRAVVQDGHVPQPTPLADILEVLGPTSFRLLGRSNDLVNIAGKRSSLGHLNFHLNSVPGVRDGAFWLPPDADERGVVRPVAFVVAADDGRGDESAFARRLVAALRERLDAAFLPRRVLRVDALPREPSTGKLPAAAFGAWAARQLADRT